MKISIVSLILLFLISCSQNNVTNPTQDQNASIQIQLNKETIPQNVAFFRFLITNDDISIIDTLSVSELDDYYRVENLKPGWWTIEVIAFDQEFNIIYHGSTFAEIIHGQVTTVSIYLDVASGTINIGLFWPEDFDLWYYDYTDGGEEVWEGMTNNFISNGALRMENPGIDYARSYFIFNSGSEYDKYKKSQMEFDLKHDGNYLKIQVMGHESDFVTPTWGPHIQILNTGILQIAEFGNIYDTGFVLESGTWYTSSDKCLNQK
jgi:hypothetical protein